MQGDRAIIERLNEALTNELTSVNQYFLHARMLDNWGYGRLGKLIYDEASGVLRPDGKHPSIEIIGSAAEVMRAGPRVSPVGTSSTRK